MIQNGWNSQLNGKMYGCRENVRRQQSVRSAAEDYTLAAGLQRCPSAQRLGISNAGRVAEIFALRWPDVKYEERVIAVRARLKKGKVRYVPMTPELADELRRFPAVFGEDRIFRRREEQRD